MPFNSDLNNVDILENFDYEQYMHEDDCDFDPTWFDPDGALEPIPASESIPSSGRVQKLLAFRAEPQSFGPKSPEDGIDSIYDTMGDEHVEPGQTPAMFERESKADVSPLADMERVDHLVSLWTTLKL